MAETDPRPTPSTSKPKLGLVVVLLAVGGLIVAAMVVARFVFYHPYDLPSASMLPTIGVRDQIWAHTTDRVPERGAVVIFKFPEKRDQQYVKRIIALGGEKVDVKKGVVSINGWAIPRCAIGPWEVVTPQDNTKHHGTLSMEYLGDLKYLVFDEDTGGPILDFGPFEVKAGEYFVLGDNRNNSFDSRHWSGGAGAGVPNDDTIGRIRSVDQPKLPPGTEKLQAAFEKCLTTAPPKTTP